MLTKINIIIILILTIFGAQASAEIQQSGQIYPVFDQITREAGLANLSVSSITQDRYGFLWFATQNGLNRYDGREFKTYKSDPYSDSGLIHNLIQTMYYDKDNHQLWLGTYQGLSQFDISTETFINYHPEENGFNPVIIAITKDDNGQIWFGTMEGLNRLNPETNQIKHYPVPEKVVRDLVIDSSGRLLIASYAGLLSYDSSKDEIAKVDINLPGDFVMAVKEYTPGILTLGLWEEGLFKVDISEEPYRIIDNYSFKDNRIYSILKIDGKPATGPYQDMEFVGTWGGGLNIITATGEILEFSPDNTSANPSHPIIYSIFQDDSSIIWLGTNGGGLNRVNPAKQNFVILAHDAENPSSLSQGKVNNIFIDKTGDIWFSIYSKGLNRYLPAENRLVKYNSNPEADNDNLTADSIMDIVEIDEGDLLLATDRGVVRYLREDDQFVNAEILPEPEIIYSLAATEEELYIGTYTEGLFIFNRDTTNLQHYNKGEISDNLIYDIMIDSKDRLWLATNNGLNLRGPDSPDFKQIFQESGNHSLPASSSFRTLFEDSKGRIWVGTVGGGISYYNEDGTFTTFLETDGLSGDLVTGILEDQEGQIWAGTHDGISIINPETEQIFNLTPEDGIGGWEFNFGHAMDENNNLYFGGIHGITRIPADFVNRDYQAPPIYITDVELFQESIADGRQHFNDKYYKFKPDSNFISFEYVALDYDSPEKIHYSYLLDGFDDDWINAGNRYYTAYSNLPPGDYSFNVKAETVRGVVTDIASFDFEIERPWYLTLPAYILYSMIFITIILITVKLREGYLLNKKNSELNELNKKLETVNRELESLSFTDSLTGIYNRHYFNRKFKELLNLSVRGNTELSLIMFDLDNFKEINDNYGHQAGDKVLQIISQQASQVLQRETDFIARYGGDEFIIVLYDTSLEGTKLIAEKLKKAIEYPKEIDLEDNTINKTVKVSIGLTNILPEQTTNTEEIIKKADQALYKAKTNGKSKIKIEL
ncbi:MAG: ligand-binding sensor domain-containing protein [Bacillota bacterium]